MKLWTSSGVIPACLGAYHLALTAFDDLIEPTFFRPVCDTCLRSMKAVHIAIAAEAGEFRTMWSAYVGFHYGFSLCLIFYGTTVALLEAPIRKSRQMTWLVCGTSLGLTAIASRHWFSAPFLTMSVSTALLGLALCFPPEPEFDDDAAY